MPKLRLLKVIVQPVFVVIDDNGNLTEQAAEPVVVSASEWPTFATTRYVEGFEELRQQVEGPPAGRPEHNGRVTKSPRKRVSP
jgi:hypothetical protein